MPGEDFKKTSGSPWCLSCHMMHPPCPDASLQCCLHPMTSLRSGEGTIGVLYRVDFSSLVPNKMSTQCSCHCLLKPLCKCAKILSEWKINTHSDWNSSKSSLMTTVLSICGGDGTLQAYLGGSTASAWGFWCRECGQEDGQWVGSDPGSRGLF